MAMSYPEFLGQFRVLCSAFGKPTDGDGWDHLCKVYWRVCRGVEEPEWAYAVSVAIENETRMPFPARLLGSVRDQRKGDDTVRCRACGVAKATFRDWCGACALARPEESGIRIERADEERDEDQRLLGVVKANPIGADEKPSEYVHRIAVEAGLLSDESEFIPF